MAREARVFILKVPPPVLKVILLWM